MPQIASRFSPGRVALLPLWSLLGCFGMLVVSFAQSPGVLSADIPPQPLAQALAAFAQQTGLQLVYVSEIADGLPSNGARAGLPPAAALSQLLAGTELKFAFVNARTVRIFAARSTRRPKPASS